jgi:hypothetical protein
VAAAAAVVDTETAINLYTSSNIISPLTGTFLF